MKVQPIRTPEKPNHRNWFSRLFFKPNWAQAISECMTPRNVCRMVEKYILYREEAGDQWTSAKETWERGYGDCEDMAVCVQTMCRELNIKVSVQLFYTLSFPIKGHAVAIGENADGTLWFSSNGSFEKVASPKEITDRIAHVLWCDSSNMWSMTLSDADVDGLVKGGTWFRDPPSTASPLEV